MVLSESRAADRAKMAGMVKAICDKFGAKCEVEERKAQRETWCKIHFAGAYVGIDFSAGAWGNRDVYCMPWNVEISSENRFSPAFGAAVGADVNPFHRRKCMGFAHGIEMLVERLSGALLCLANGEAFLVPAKEEAND